MKKIHFLLCLFAFSGFIAKAQQRPLECGKYKIDTAAEETAKQFGTRSNSPLAVNRLVRVYFYIVANDDGGSPAASPAQIDNEFNQLVNDYSANSLCFANMGYRYIYSTNINFNINCDDPVSYAALNPWLVPNCITIFFQRRLSGNSGTYGGSAYAVPNTYCSVATGNINSGRTTSHEVGHCLGLIHTFETYGTTTYENINGSNCAGWGDKVCDTPADPYGRSCASVSNCVYTGNCVDANGASNYSPPVNNIMAYWPIAAGCPATNFTNGQFARANTFLGSDAGLLSTQSASNTTVGPSTYNSTYGMLSAIFNLNTTGAFNCTNNCVVSLTARTVTLTNGFRASPTTGKVTIKGTTCFY
jgi:hypothetical protein